MQDGNSPYRDGQLLERLFYDEGMTRQEIAEKYDVTYRTVNRWLKKHNLQPETRSRKYGRLEMCNSYRVFVDYNGTGQENKVYIHRLVAVAEYGFGAVADNVVHHNDGVKLHNSRDNIEVMSNAEHVGHHSQERSDQLSELWSDMWDRGVFEDRDS